MLKILAVDDLRDAADSLALLFQQKGHQSIAAYDGQEAVETALKFEPDIVILDIDMPLMDGCSAAKEIMQVARKAPKLIALTGVRNEEILNRVREAGFDAYIPKPADLVMLLSLVDAYEARLAGD